MEQVAAHAPFLCLGWSLFRDIGDESYRPGEAAVGNIWCGYPVVFLAKQEYAGSAERAAQIDMVIERGDNTINLCEMKFSESEFAINKDYEKILRNKIVRFMEETKTRKSIQLTFISSYGLQRNMYSGIAQNEVVLNDLF